MGADGCNKNDWVVGMAERAACGQVVRRRAGGCGHADAIRLHRGEVLVIAKDLKGRHGWCEVSAPLLQDGPPHLLAFGPRSTTMSLRISIVLCGT